MVFASSDILTDLGQFFSNMFRDLESGLLFFGGPWDIVVAVLDILTTTLVIYYILKILRDSRAWQLLKGVLLIVAFAILCSLLGLTTVGFLFNNTFSVLAIAFVVIFQPELRRALETFGRNSFNVLSSAITQDEAAASSGSAHNLIESIVRACEKMIESRTGALIIVERQTRLGELVEQENVISLESAVSSTMLTQIFFKGSPLHDGAVLIRDGRIAAARIHVPLSDNYHLRKDHGTRHRAAIGASEMGDAIAVVVSEERGSISVAIEGRLYTLDNPDALRTLLHKLVGTSRRQSGRLSSLGTIFRSSKRSSSGRNRITTRQRVLLMVSSLAIAIGLWLYVQVTVNPVDSKSFVVDLTFTNLQSAQLSGYEFDLPSSTIQVTLQGRQKAIDELALSDVIAYVDLDHVSQAGQNWLEIEINTTGPNYIEPIRISPAQISIEASTREDN